jgi:hypothetical protein
MSSKCFETPVLKFDRLTGHRIPSEVSRVHPSTTWLLVTIGISDDPSPRTFDDKLHLSKLLFRQYYPKINFLRINLPKL